MGNKQISRRDFLKSSALAASGAVLLPHMDRLLDFNKLSVPEGFRVSGIEVPGLESFDQTMYDFMTVRDVPCGALAVVRNGKLVFARGYNYAHLDVPDVQPTSLFRVASVSKPFTATAIMRLVEDGQLNLEDRLVDLIELEPIPGTTPDPRLSEITVLNLLQHQGGWDRSIEPDPMFQDKVIARTLDIDYPITQEDIMTYVTSQELQHDPGTVYAYSNYGYLLLGKIIEQVTGLDYSAYVNEKIFTPLGITRMRQGRSLPEYRYPDEVPYFSTYIYPAVFPDIKGAIPRPDGTFNLENMEAHGAWLSSPVDLVRFATAFDTPESSPLLSAETIETMLARPAVGFEDSAWYYACGWLVRPKPISQNVWHDGSLPGTISLLVRRWDGLDWAVVFNQRDDQHDRQSKTYFDIDGALHVAADAVIEWPDPEYDQFPDFF